MRKKITEPEELEGPLKINKALKVVYIITLVIIIGMGVYTLIAGTGFGFTMYGKYGGEGKQMAYGPFQYFMMAGILIVPGIFIWMFGDKKSFK